MGSLAEIYIKKETLATLLKVVEKKGEKGVSITLSINDETNAYGQNVSGFVSQSKEQREVKKEKFYVANGSVFWTDGKISKAVKAEEVKAEVVSTDGTEDDLPF